MGPQAVNPNPRKDPLAQAPVAPPLLKICGLKQPSQAAAIAALGVDAIGVIAVPGSPRYVEPALRAELFDAARRPNPDVHGVLVVADPDNSALEPLGPGQGHSVLQLHGSESPQRCGELRRLLGGLSLWKALRIRSAADLEQAQAYRGCVDAVLLDAWVEGVLGGTGKRLPVEWLDGFQPGLPWWLAGGLDPTNTGAVLQQLQPTGIDASSGVERSPGDKDLERVAALLAVVRTPRQDQRPSPNPTTP